MERAAELWSQVIQVALNVIKITCQPEASTRGISDINVMATSKLKLSRWKQEGNYIEMQKKENSQFAQACSRMLYPKGQTCVSHCR